MYLETGNDTPKNGNDTPKTGKKTRVKKFLIKDKVIIFQISFEEKNINIQEKQNINKTLTMPRILSKMRKMKQFYAKNKENNGKLAMPKSCQLLNDRAGKSTTFGSDLIYDYDQSDVVGSRKDFASHCHIIDPYSGELLKDLNFNNSESIQNIQENETHRINQHADFMSDNETSFTPTISNDENSILRNCEANNSYLTLCNPDSSILPEQQSCASIMSQLSINLDEGIDVSDPLDLLLASPKLTINILKLTTSPEMIECYLNTKRKMEDSNSLLTRSFYETRDRILNSPSEFVLPLQIQSTVADSRLRNILMIPVQKLKHKCAFDLPGSEFFMYKKMKMNQHKSTVEDATTKRMFKTIDCCNAGEIIRECSVALDSPPCFGFSQDELEESLQTVHVITPLELLIKSENDVLRARSRSRTPSETLCPHRNSSDSYDSGIGSTTIGNDSNNLTNTMTDFGEDLDRTRKTDSCYQSMISGMSGTTGEVHEFMKSGPSSTPFDHNANDVDDDEPSENVDHLLTHKPGTQIIEMQKLATNVSI